MINEPERATIVVIGGGLGGTLVAAHLLARKVTKDARRRRLRVVLIERAAGRLARGVAYSTKDRVHLLNVPACNMSAFSDDTDHFLHWCERQGLAVTRDTFVPRMVYGEYLQDVLQDAKDSAAPGNALEIFDDEATAVDADEEAQCAMVRLNRRGTLFANRVVIASGNYAPLNPRFVSANFSSDSPSYIRDPWQTDALEAVDLQQPVLLVGTGLTMVDIALSLKSRGLQAPLFALSRHGLLPQAHREAQPLVAFDFPVDGAITARKLWRTVRERVRQIEDAGHDWRACVNALRPLTQRLWQALDATEQRRFLRHARPYWEVHRHRMAPEVAASIERLLIAGQLKIAAGRIETMREVDGQMEVAFRERGREDVSRLRVGCVINCTGPASDVRRIDDTLIHHLLKYGYLAPDELGLGAEVSGGGALINLHGEESSTLFTLGSWRRPLLWETTAAPEIRAQAAALADHLATSLGAQPASLTMPHAETPIVPREQSVYDWVI